MKLCVINSGLTHTVNRTIAMASYIEEIHYIDVTGKVIPNIFDSHENIDFYDLGEQIGRDGFSKLIKLLHKLNPDIIVCHYIAGTMLTAAVVYGQCPVVGIAMGTDVLHEKGDRVIVPSMVYLRKLCYRQLAFIAAKSEAIKQRLVEYRVKNEISVNYWGCNRSLFKPAPKLLARQNIQLPNEDFIILSPRAIAPLYNIHLIFEAVILLYESNNIPNIRLVIIGRTSVKHKTYRDELESFAEKHNFRDKVNFVYDVDPCDVVTYINAADCVLSMAASEGFPNTAFEVWSCERPLIIGHLAELDELIYDNENALYCDFTAEDIADKVTTIANHAVDEKSIISNGFKTVTAYGDIAENGKCFAEYLHGIFKKNKQLKPGLAGRSKVFFIYYLIKLKNKWKRIING